LEMPAYPGRACAGMTVFHYLPVKLALSVLLAAGCTRFDQKCIQAERHPCESPAGIGRGL